MPEPRPAEPSPLPHHPEVVGQERYVTPASQQTRRDLVDHMRAAQGESTTFRKDAANNEYIYFRFFLSGERPDNAFASLYTSTIQDGQQPVDRSYSLRDGANGEIDIVSTVRPPRGMRPKYTLRLGEGVENRIILERIEAERQDPTSAYYDDGLGPPSEGEIRDIIDMLNPPPPPQESRSRRLIRLVRGLPLLKQLRPRR